jgi:hypothetical protein
MGFFQKVQFSPKNFSSVSGSEQKALIISRQESTFLFVCEDSSHAFFLLRLSTQSNTLKHRARGAQRSFHLLKVTI